MKHAKNILSLLLVNVLIVTLFPVSAFAEGLPDTASDAGSYNEPLNTDATSAESTTTGGEITPPPTDSPGTEPPATESLATEPENPVLEEDQQGTTPEESAESTDDECVEDDEFVLPQSDAAALESLEEAGEKGELAVLDAPAGMTLAEAFPDVYFRNYVKTQVLGNGSLGESDMITEIQAQAIAAFSTVDVVFKNIASLKGIEYFTQLTSLYCNMNRLASLDVSSNTKLTILDCSSNQITSLDVSNNTALDHLDCYSNQLASLDVSNNTTLIKLLCSSNQITTLDVSNNTALDFLDCYSNQLTSLDVSNNTKLTKLLCSSNQITSLDVSSNTKLTILDCSSNQLSSLDVSNNTELIGLYCEGNQLTSLDVSKNTVLTELNCRNNQLTSLDVANTALNLLNCSNNHLLSIKGLPKSVSVFIANDQTLTIPVRARASGEHLYESVETYPLDEGFILTVTPSTASHDAATAKSRSTNYDSVIYDTESQRFIATDLGSASFTATDTVYALSGLLAFDLLTTHLVKFVDYDGSVLKSEQVISGQHATPPESPTREGHTFLGWDKNYRNITEDTTIVALYEKHANPVAPGGTTPSGGNTPDGNTPGGNTPGGGTTPLAGTGNSLLPFLLVSGLLIGASILIAAGYLRTKREREK